MPAPGVVAATKEGAEAPVASNKLSAATLFGARTDTLLPAAALTRTATSWSRPSPLARPTARIDLAAAFLNALEVDAESSVFQRRGSATFGARWVLRFGRVPNFILPTARRADELE